VPNKGYKFTKKAVKDLSSIWNYTFDYWSEKQADKYYNDIIKKCNQISKKADIGKIYVGIFDSLRGLKINKHIIFYRTLEDSTIEIERILHERMDLKNRIDSESL